MPLTPLEFARRARALHGSREAVVDGDAATVGEIVVRGNVVMEGYFRDPEATERAMLTAEEVQAFARERLAGFKCPKSVTFLDELPKTATGKILKYVLRGGRAAVSTQ